MLLSTSPNVCQPVPKNPRSRGPCIFRPRLACRIWNLSCRPVSGLQATASLPEGVDSVLTSGTLIAGGLCVLGSAALAVSAPATREAHDEDADGKNVEYSIMGVISCIPLVNWTAWILPALANPERSSLYWAYSLLYCVPLLRNGFDIDGYVLAMLVLGILHVQAERIALTEPDTLRDIKPLQLLLRATVFFVEKGSDFASSLFQILEADSQQIAQRKGDKLLDDDSSRGRDSKDLEAPEDADKYQLKEFDRRMLERRKKESGSRQQLPSQQPRQRQQAKDEEGSDNHG